MTGLRLGDSVSHCAYSEDHLIVVMDEIGSILRSYFPLTTFAIALVSATLPRVRPDGVLLKLGKGNNDVFPHNTLKVGPSPLLDRISSVWRKYDFLSEDSLQTFERGGFYSLDIGSGLSIIALNTMYYFGSLKGDNGTTLIDESNYLDDPVGQFEWLSQELERCRNQSRG